MKHILLLFVMFFLVGTHFVFSQTSTDKEHYDIAVYVAGSQDDQLLPASIQTVILNKTITKLAEEGIYRLIEQNNEFTQKMQNAQSIQSGNVVDGQIAEIGATYGAQKICVVYVTIIEKYLYVATRMVDVLAKASFEMGDAESSSYISIPILTKTLDIALTKMFSFNHKEASQTETKTIPDSQKYNSEQTMNSYQSPAIPNFETYKMRVNKDKGTFLNNNSQAYREYLKYQNNKVAGSVCFSIGIAGLAVGLPFLGMAIDDLIEVEYYDASTYYYTGNDEVWLTWLISGATTAGIGLILTIAGISELGTMNKHLTKSYHYYVNGEKQTATINFHPYFGVNKTVGAGLTVHF